MRLGSSFILHILKIYVEYYVKLCDAVCPLTFIHHLKVLILEVISDNYDLTLITMSDLHLPSVEEELSCAQFPGLL